MSVKNTLELELQEIALTNFRCFELIKVSFSKRVTVFIGENGVGKTTLLEGIAGMLQPLVKRITGNITASKIDGFGELDIKNGTLIAVNTIDTLINKELPLSWSADLDIEGYESEELGDQTAFNELDTGLSALRHLLREQQPINLPVIIYYPCIDANKSLTNGISKEKSVDTLFKAYDNALNKKSFDYQEFSDWFIWQMNLAKETGNFNLVNTISQALFDVLSDEGRIFSAIRSTFKNPRHRNGELVLQKNETEISINQLSSGERIVFGLVGDLARRLALLNQQKEQALTGNGIVLIDEIDLHLHPIWQKRIVPKLCKIFPEVQFIITTHSPLVVANLEVATTDVFILKNDLSAEKMEHFSGRSITDIMYEFYGVQARPEATQKAIDDLFLLIEKGNLKSATKALKKLKKQLGADDAAIIDAQSSIELQEELS